MQRSDNPGLLGEITLTAQVPVEQIIEKGWSLPIGGLPIFTTPRPRSSPGRRPAERLRWEGDQFRYPPYQYRDVYGIWSRDGRWRMASTSEKELLMGFPLGYTRACVSKQYQQGTAWDDERNKLLGNSWQVGVAAWLISHLAGILGIGACLTPQQVVNRCFPWKGEAFASLLLRPPLQVGKQVTSMGGDILTRKLMGLVSMKGEDILLQSSSEQLVKYQRLRTSVPSQLWVWREIAGWSWSGSKDHINVLEMRAILTTVKWLAQKQQLQGVRLVHLTDNLVCLHALARGRTSSRKLRRTLIRIQSILLRHDLHPLWAYVHTSANPADRPSRQGFCIKKKWVKR